MFELYKITTPTGKTYYGQHENKKFPIDDGYMGSGILLLKSFKKYGKINHIKEILEISEDKVIIDILEIGEIWYKSKIIKEDCLNIAQGGQNRVNYDPMVQLRNSISHIGVKQAKQTIEKRKVTMLTLYGGYSVCANKKKNGKKHTLETINKMSKSAMGRIMKPETKEKLRNINLGKVSWNKGVPCSDETKQKMSEKLKGRSGYWQGKKRSQETRDKISKTKTGKKRNWKQLMAADVVSNN
jgi:hypothetical protein